MPKPRISRLNTWQNFKQNIQLVLKEALLLLQSRSHLLHNENELNYQLFFCFREVCHKLNLSNHLPTPEGQNPPHETDHVRSKRLSKRPDFYWQYVDNTCELHACDKRFVIECKRLGSPETSDWIFNQNYICNGIMRFILEDWGYAKGDEEGAMIGYVQTMDLQKILDEVNSTASSITQFSIPMLVLASSGWQINHISELTQTLNRTFIQSPFILNHFWIDLRSFYTQSIQNSAKQVSKKIRISKHQKIPQKLKLLKNRSNS